MLPAEPEHPLLRNLNAPQREAVTHVDGGARVQTVSRRVNPAYYDLIAEFDRLTGVPAVLNTSFNVRGEPIVNSPKDALRCFFTTDLDFLFIGDEVVWKERARCRDALRAAAPGLELEQG